MPDRSWLTLPDGSEACSIAHAARSHGRDAASLPFAIRVLVENLQRHHLLDAGDAVSAADVQAAVRFREHAGHGLPLVFERVILPDSSGAPALLDLAALRDAVAAKGGDPALVNPLVPVDLVVDHSLQVDHAGQRDALERNLEREIQRNSERYEFLKWAEGAFANLTIVPPGAGIIHQVNLEAIAPVVMERIVGSRRIRFPDFLVGGDSHTPMINGIGVLGWGVGGIDAEAAMLGIPLVVAVPEVVGVRLMGALPPGATTTDAALLITQRLRREKVTGAFVEYFGPGIDGLTVPERASIANMAPEYGATCGFFPIDAAAIAFIAATRGKAHAAMVEAYARANSLFRDAAAAEPEYSRIVEIDLSEARPAVAGPSRPQDRIALDAVAGDFRARLGRPLAEGGFAAGVAPDGLRHGAVVIAALTSCTNTSNPSVMLAAGLLARNAVARGLRPAAHVKTSLAPGSPTVTRYLEKTGLMPALEALGFHVVGYGCTTCGGKSGPLDPAVAEAVESGGAVAAAVLSGNRNFEGRIHRLVRANYIMSPPLVVAYALAGTVGIDLDRDPLGRDADGRPVHLRDLWPASEEIAALLPQTTSADVYDEVYRGAARRVRQWDAIEAQAGTCFAWNRASLYMLEPPFFSDVQVDEASCGDVADLRVLGLFGDSLTTDHISPSGEIPLNSPAGQYLLARGVQQKDFNTYVGRRGNHEIMARATFCNLRIKNLLVPEREGGVTIDFTSGEQAWIYDAAMAYRRAGIGAIILAGQEYGTGSSRDWAAKGCALLGVRAVIAGSFERIHRSNLIGMGVMPLRFAPGESWRGLGLTGHERFAFSSVREALAADAPVRVVAAGPQGEVRFDAWFDDLTASEKRILLSGGIQPAVLNHFLSAAQAVPIPEPSA